jgi:hypothetical protein
VVASVSVQKALLDMEDLLYDKSVRRQDKAGCPLDMVGTVL